MLDRKIFYLKFCSNLELAIDKALTLSESLEKIWVDGDLKQRQKLQHLVFPSGLGYDKSNDHVRTPKDTYSIFTRNEKENKLLAQVNKLMAVVDEIEEHNKVYKMTLAQSMPNLLNFNMRTQELNMKPQHFR